MEQLLTMALNSGADVFVPAFEPKEDILNINRDINYEKNIISCKKRKLKFIVKRDICFRLLVVS